MKVLLHSAILLEEFLQFCDPFDSTNLDFKKGEGFQTKSASSVAALRKFKIKSVFKKIYNDADP